jgi:phage terminase large subunit
MFNNQKATILFKQNYYAKSNTIVNQGGSHSGKTFAIQQVLFCHACEAEKQVITVVGQDIPNLKAGVLRDALSIYNSSETLQALVKSYNKTDRVFEFHNGSVIEYESYRDNQDAKSGKRDYLFVNEANGIGWEIYSELALRTKKQVFIEHFSPFLKAYYYINKIDAWRKGQPTKVELVKLD